MAPDSTVHRSISAARQWAAEEFFPARPDAETVDVLARYSSAQLVGEFRVDRTGEARKVVRLDAAESVPAPRETVKR